MTNHFKCKAEEAGYCNQWLRSCVSWNNCNLARYGAPSPGCNASSPLDREECNGCEWQSWKKENYVD